jgi:hypothetical protein
MRPPSLADGEDVAAEARLPASPRIATLSPRARGDRLRTSTRLAGIELEDWRGEPIPLGTFWRERPVVLVFIRHFG